MAPDRMSITETALLEELRAALEARADGPDDAMTGEELDEALEWGSDKRRKIVKRLVRSGAMECVDVQRRTVTGALRPIPGYRLKGAG